MEKSKKSPHALVLPYPAQGHINPMLQFCKRLVSKGIKVTLANTIYISKSMLADPQSPVSLETYSDGFDEGGSGQAESTDIYLSTLRNVGSQTMGNLIKKLDQSGNPVNVLIYDGFLPWALDVANNFGLKKAVFFTQTCAVNIIYYHVYKGLISLPPRDDESSVISVPGLPLFKSWEAPAPLDYADLLINQFSNVDKADWVFFNTFHKLEEEVLGYMPKLWKVRTVGPTLPSMYLDKRLEDDKDYGINLFKPNYGVCMKWLSDKPSGSVIYVSFGSFIQVDAEQMEEIAWGLKDSNFNFLWVVRELEKAKLPNNFINEISEKGLVVTWSPQLEILIHESIGCFVTHCGFNSVLEAISLGVPMVGIPQWSDQPANGKYVEDVWGVGVRAKPDEQGIVKRSVLKSSIKEVMEGEKGEVIKKNAAKWKNLATEAVAEGGTSDMNINEFVAELLHC
ncbi:Glycosyltransferase [Heracleum sosnowskyi]|uniref:Glycosyltransferase n=1 Tax=Heracleum sosnowskyi TaxID=360622 RepID=A0AAD8HKA8_9APIA|nr:Glycosyltransferase [Heracleum sosnowskyi]